MQFKKFTFKLLKNDEIVLNDTYINEEPNSNVIKFQLLDYVTTLDLDNKILIRENNDFKFNLDIFNKNCTILLKKENIEIPISVELCELEVLLDKITIEYILESEDAKNKIIITKGDKNE